MKKRTSIAQTCPLLARQEKQIVWGTGRRLKGGNSSFSRWVRVIFLLLGQGKGAGRLEDHGKQPAAISPVADPAPHNFLRKIWLHRPVAAHHPFQRNPLPGHIDGQHLCDRLARLHDLVWIATNLFARADFYARDRH